MDKRIKHRGIKNKLGMVLPLFTIVFVGLVYFYADSFRQRWNYDWSGIRTPVKDAVLELEEGFAQPLAKIDILDKKEWLINNASKPELTKLLEYPLPAIRAIAYEGLFRRRDPNAYNLLVKALNDKEEFALYIAGIGGKKGFTVGEYIVDEVLLLELTLNLPPRPDQEKIRYDFTDNELKVIDSLYTLATFKYE